MSTLSLPQTQMWEVYCFTTSIMQYHHLLLLSLMSVSTILKFEHINGKVILIMQMYEGYVEGGEGINGAVRGACLLPTFYPLAYLF